MSLTAGGHAGLWGPWKCAKGGLTHWFAIMMMPFNQIHGAYTVAREDISKHYRQLALMLLDI